MASIFKKFLHSDSNSQSKKSTNLSSSGVISSGGNVSSGSGGFEKNEDELGSPLWQSGSSSRDLRSSCPNNSSPNNGKIQFKLSESNFNIKTKKKNATIGTHKSSFNLYASPSLESNSFLVPSSPYSSNIESSPRSTLTVNNSINNSNSSPNSSPNALRKSQSTNSPSIVISNIGSDMDFISSPTKDDSKKKKKSNSIIELRTSTSSPSIPLLNTNNLSQSQIIPLAGKLTPSASSNMLSTSTTQTIGRKKSSLSFIADLTSGKKKSQYQQQIKELNEEIENLKKENLKLGDCLLLEKIKSEIKIANLYQSIENLSGSNDLLVQLLQDYQRENIELKTTLSEYNMNTSYLMKEKKSRSIEEAIQDLDNHFVYFEKNQSNGACANTDNLTEIYKNIRLLPSPVHAGMDNIPMASDIYELVTSPLSTSMSLSSEGGYPDNGEFELNNSINLDIDTFQGGIDDNKEECEQEKGEEKETYIELESPKLVELLQCQPGMVSGASSAKVTTTFSSLSPLSNSLNSCSSVTTNNDEDGFLCSESPISVKNISLIESQYLPNFKEYSNFGFSTSPNSSFTSTNTSNRSSANISLGDMTNITMQVSPKPLTCKSTCRSSTSTITPNLSIASPVVSPITVISKYETNEPKIVSNKINIDDSISIIKPTPISPKSSQKNNLTSSGTHIPTKRNPPTRSISNISPSFKYTTFSHSTGNKALNNTSSTSRSVNNSPQLESDSFSAVKRLVDFFESPSKSPVKL